MAFVTYTASRSIIGSHSNGGSYSIDFDAQSVDIVRKVVANQNTSLDGSLESNRLRGYLGYRVKTDFVDEGTGATNLDGWFEFMDSVSNGETFTFDPYGTSGSPTDNITAVMLPGSFSVSRVGASKVQEISFEVRKYPNAD